MPQPSPERAHHEEKRLHSIKEYIDYLAFVYSRDEPDQEEDIAQESQLAVVKKLRQDPDCHISHLKVRAKSGIREYRRRGKSVDGKLNETTRQRHYSIIDIDRVVTEDGNTLADTLNDHRLPSRITEEQALNRALIAQLRRLLTVEENLALTLRLWEVPWREIGKVFNHSNGRTATIRDRIETVAARVLTPFTEEQPNGN